MTTTRFRGFKILGWCAAILLVILAICIVVMLTFDWNRARPWLNQRVSEAAGRPFAIRGDLSLHWLRPQEEQGWHAWIPWPQLTAKDIVLDNTDWAKTGQHMIEVAQVTFSLRLLPLLEKKIVLPELQLDTPLVMLERAADGKNNWTFPPSAPSKWEVDLQKLVLAKGTVRLLDPLQKIDIKANIDTLPITSKEGYGIGWNVAGNFNKAPMTGSGKAGAVLSLQNSSTPYPLQASVRVGKTAIDIQGNLTKPSDLAALDLRLKVSGASMDALYPLTGIVLPATPPFSTEGRLIGKLQGANSSWTYEKFSGHVGESDLGGTLTYIAKKPRPLLQGNLVSNQLRLQDLGPLIGADSNASKANRGATKMQPANKVLPTEEFNTERWGSIDADVNFVGHKIIRSEELPIQNLKADIHLNNSLLSLTPLNFGVAGGNLVSTIKLDGSNKTIKADIALSARHLKIKQLFPKLESTRASLGEINGDAALSGTGNSVASLLATSNGELKTLINQGTMSKFILEAAGLNIGNVVLSKLFGDKQVKLNCLASDFSITHGLMQTRTFLLDTDDAIIDISGQINLANETLALNIRPKSKGLRIISLRSPLYIAGTFKNPDVGVDKGVLALKAGGAIALGILAPVAALVPLINLGSEQQTDCASLLGTVKLKPSAPKLTSTPPPPAVSAH
ncbi:AsmA family protein [Glaciimonas sp. PCH181]|uniref:AsmA family protein n=1 Tax=Glaciimonas sp. PCH181 TaxID=2133943 RepID=UPI000D3C2C2E|nr:AsmA family protein [Glaciimonas sp. PCH181]PUA17916.1 AsmA family protein [Glaciimonas sp. PCH181]